METARRSLALLAMLTALGAQVLLASHVAPLRGDDDLLPPPPPKALLRLEAFGDDQALFRLLGLEVQNFGDGEGHFSSLSSYDYQRLRDWLELLDGLDGRSSLTLALAGALYGQTGDQARARMMADYLYRRGMKDPVRHWHWLATAVWLARHRGHDPALAMRIAVDAAALRDPGIPEWVRSLPSFVVARMADQDAARQMVEAILSSRPDLAAEDRKALERLAR
ncbi:MAG TPA: hypothetical protein VM661_09390 [Candidatus Sulfotelmatobacter sp.]|jgi:hypothetical protein|nr:hypothetical protein [Candidatus Sulfotelmatobacter sp.]